MITYANCNSWRPSVVGTDQRRWSRRVLRIATIGLVLLNGSVAAQSPRSTQQGSVRILVRDATSLPIYGAEVSLQALDASMLKAATNDRGVALLEELPPGLYSGRVESAGFDAFAIEPFSVRAGARVTRDITLQVAGFVEELDVTPALDDQLLMNAFTTQLGPEQLAALPEDPEELARVLYQLLGDDADIRVDGFSDGRLPPGTQIQEIRVRYDVGAASSGAGPRVEIRTAPGGDRWRNDAGVSVRDESLNARNAFSGCASDRADAAVTWWNLNGPVVQDRTGLSVSVHGSESMDNQIIRAAAPDGIYSGLVEQPSRRVGLWTRVEHHATPTQSVRIEVGHAVNQAQNQGITEFDPPERAVTNNGTEGSLRFGHHATVGGRFVNDLRFTFGWDSNEASSVSSARTIRVLDAFTSGGAQRQGGRRSRTVELENDLEFTVRRLHRISAGVRVDGADYHGDENSNTSGTYTFANLEAFDAGRPTTFTQRLGDPTFAYRCTGSGGTFRTTFASDGI